MCLTFGQKHIMLFSTGISPLGRDVNECFLHGECQASCT